MINKKKILLIDADGNFRTVIQAVLDSAGYDTIQAGTGAEGRAVTQQTPPELILMDLALPDEDGLTFLKWLRQSSLIPVIVLSARADETSKVMALDMGANDYITKPFNAGEFLARVRVALRYSEHNAEDRALPGGVFRTGALMVRCASRQVYIAGKEVKLTQTEYNILSLLCERSGEAITYNAIIRSIWGYTDRGSIKKLQVNIANIRKKLEIPPGRNGYVTNEPGVGYRIHMETII